MQDFVNKVVEQLVSGQENISGPTPEHTIMPPPKNLIPLGPATKLEFNYWYQLPEVEKVRSYIYQDSDKSAVIEVHNVIAICISKSGNHRLLTTDNVLVFVAPGWKALECDPPISY